MNETTTPTLAPCPFCGKATVQAKEELCWVECNSLSCGYESPARETLAEAAAVHNALAADVAMGKLAPKLVEAVKQYQAAKRSGDAFAPAMAMIDVTAAIAKFDALTAPTKEAAL